MTANPQRAISALILVATLMYLVSVAPGLRYRRAMRAVALAVYAIAMGVVLVWVGLWIMGAQ
jgi:hypothetical protein